MMMAFYLPSTTTLGVSRWRRCCSPWWSSPCNLRRHYHHHRYHYDHLRIDTSRRRSSKHQQSSSSSSYRQLLSEFRKEIDALPEQRALLQLQEFLTNPLSSSSQQRYQQVITNNSNNNNDGVDYAHVMTASQARLTLEAAMATFLLHVESRKAALVGKGFYTIGPCGEELLASAAHSLIPTMNHQQDDTVALHYRHVSINLARQLLLMQQQRQQQQQQQYNNDIDIDNDDQILYSILLDRARGYTVRRTDPVTGGVHCAIGTRSRCRRSPPPFHHPNNITDDNNNNNNNEWSDGIGSDNNDYVVTSTLASQCPPAVGRALGFALQQQQRSSSPSSSSSSSSSRPISFVTVGDGSVHHSHFWSAYHLARHARHTSIQCPVLFGISDNGLSISYHTRGYVQTLFDTTTKDPWMSVFVANANDMYHVFDQMQQATTFVRTRRAPAVILYQGLVRRFGHAATDRQWAYLNNSDITQRAEWDVLALAIQQAVQVFSHWTFCDARQRFEQLQPLVTAAFCQAIDEEAQETVTREQMIQQVAPSVIISVPRLPDTMLQSFDTAAITTTTVSNDDEQTKNNNNSSTKSDGSASTAKRQPKREVMRKHMTRVLEEVMTADESIVYLGEDVKHGGYYLVTDGLNQKFPGRILDFPPDETSLLGAAMGFAQLGLLPIVEIPYAKYLDCGADMFYESAIMNWLTAGQCPNGMVIRMQGFDRGLFGGNFHTHNMLSHMPPGVDVVCYSNGEDYVRGFRHAIRQAKEAKRVVMTIDCTHLLNLRHLHDKLDRQWERCYPEFDGSSNANMMMSFDDVRRHGTAGKWAIVTYGNGVVTSLQARKRLLERHVIAHEEELDIIDCPYLSSVPKGLGEISLNYKGLLFADICKEGPGSNVLSSMITALHQDNLLPPQWEFVGAPRTYNPLGSTVTFLNASDVEQAFERLIRK